MKKLLLNTLFVFVGFNCFAQDAVVAVSRQNQLFIGLMNRIEVAMPNVPSSQLTVTVDNNAEITKVSEGIYDVSVVNVGELTITVSGNGKISKKKFRVKYLPDPVPMLTIAMHNKDTLLLSNLKSVDGLVAPFMNIDIEGKCPISEYTISIVPRFGESKQIQNIGCCFSSQTKQIFALLKPNDKIFFTNIKARCPGDKLSRDLQTLTVNLK